MEKREDFVNFAQAFFIVANDFRVEMIIKEHRIIIIFEKSFKVGKIVQIVFEISCSNEQP